MGSAVGAGGAVQLIARGAKSAGRERPASGHASFAEQQVGAGMARPGAPRGAPLERGGRWVKMLDGGPFADGGGDGRRRAAPMGCRGRNAAAITGKGTTPALERACQLHDSPGPSSFPQRAHASIRTKPPPRGEGGLAVERNPQRKGQRPSAISKALARSSNQPTKDGENCLCC
jgi:hypothetical protein